MVELNDTIIPVENVLYAQARAKENATWELTIYLKGGGDVGWIYSSRSARRNAIAELEIVRSQMKALDGHE